MGNLGMERVFFWDVVQGKPGNLVKVVWLSVANFFGVNVHLKVKTDPVCRHPIMLSVHVTES